MSPETIDQSSEALRRSVLENVFHRVDASRHGCQWRTFFFFIDSEFLSQSFLDDCIHILTIIITYILKYTQPVPDLEHFLTGAKYKIGTLS